ncbi:MAG: lysoplasmalogenase family protein [Candidatus Faecivicinus sp.]
MSLLILIPTLFAALQLITRKYIFSALTTLSCAVISAKNAPVLAAALAVSAVGDWFMSHKGHHQKLYIAGIAFFLVGHALFIVQAILRIRAMGRPRALAGSLVAGGVLSAAMIAYLLMRVLPMVPKLMKLPVVLYTLISLASFTCALMTGDVLYAVGIALLLFSDTMIGESDFVGNRRAGPLILPTYYLCHILVALSALLR